MPAKRKSKKSNKKPPTTFQWFKSQRSGMKMFIFLIAFVVIGGGFAAYKASAATRWEEEVNHSLFKISTCKYVYQQTGGLIRYRHWMSVYNKDNDPQKFRFIHAVTGRTYNTGYIPARVSGRYNVFLNYGLWSVESKFGNQPLAWRDSFFFNNTELSTCDFEK